MDWPAIKTRMNMLDFHGSTSSGWTPQVATHYNASGTIDVGAGVYVILKVGLAVSVLGGLSVPRSRV